MSTLLHRSMRLDSNDFAEIARLASQRNMPWTRFLIDTALGRLPEVQAELQQRVTDLEDRLSRVEAVQFSEA